MRSLLQMIFSFLFLFAVGSLVGTSFAFGQSTGQSTEKVYQNPAFLYDMPDAKTFATFSTTPGRTSMTRVVALKVTLDLRSSLVHFANAEFYPMHYELASDFLDFKQGIAVFNHTQYASHKDRYLLLGQLIHHQATDIYTLFFDPVTQVSCAEIKMFYDRVRATSFIGNKLLFHVNKPERAACTGIRKISTKELYKGQTFQALNIAETYGYLRKLKAADLDKADITRRDLLVLDGLPNDVPVVAGLITSEFQTPLSHLNVLSAGRGTPNMALKNAMFNPELVALEGKLVHLRVLPNDYEIRAASLEQAQAFWRARDPQTPVNLARNVQATGLVELSFAGAHSTVTIGAKAANFAELANMGMPVPEDHFAIPFYFYDQHMKKNGLYKVLDAMIAEEKFHQDPTHRRARLKTLRKLIKDAPLDPHLNKIVHERIGFFSRFPSYRFRSSTNAEDLAIFSGAGLYDSTSAKRANKKKTVERAVKKVWASLWNWRAFEERDYYRINQKQLAMGILVARSFPDEDANGVLITKNLYGTTPAHTINVAPKEFSIVLPEDGFLNDQILMQTWALVPGGDFSIEYLTRTDRPGFTGKSVMSDKELNALSALATNIKKHYFDKRPEDSKVNYTDFAMELEFKLDSTLSPRRLYIKQARPFRVK